MKSVMHNYTSKNDINIRQIVAYKDNKLEIEENLEGFTKEDTMNVMSVTKSITSLLVGIAIDKSFIKSVDDYIMTLDNKLNILDSAELARMEERISKRKALELFESRRLDEIEAGSFEALKEIRKALFKGKLQIYAGDVSGSSADECGENATGHFRWNR